MTRNEFNNLKIGDICVITKKLHQSFGKKGEVVYKDETHVVLKSLNGEPFVDTGMRANLTVKHWQSIGIAE